MPELIGQHDSAGTRAFCVCENALLVWSSVFVFLWFFLSSLGRCVEGGTPMAYEEFCKTFCNHAEQFAEFLLCW